MPSAIHKHYGKRDATFPRYSSVALLLGVSLLIFSGVFFLTAEAKSKTTTGLGDPCALVTKAEVESMLGVPVENGVSKSSAGEEVEGDLSTLLEAKMCSYMQVPQETATVSISKTLSIIVGRFRNQEEALMYFNEDCGEVGDSRFSTPQRLVGLGDSACSLGALVSVLKSDVKLLILYDTGNPKNFDMSSPDAALVASKITPLAMKAVSRLP